ncbi:MAG: MerR family transcriptional regulator [Chloroflexi bacterium]|nr:MerR family transcriptional regulator [Chloroflexota bacterium]
MKTETIAPPEKETMSIGELARRIGLTTRTVRYYEEMGLLVGVTRGTNGRRIYTEEDLYQLRLIRRGKLLLGLSLAEMKELVEVFRQTGTERSVIQRSIEILTSHLDEVEDKLKKLESYRRLLAAEIKRVKGLL